MYQNPQINENVNSNTGAVYVPQVEPFDIYSNGLQQPPSNLDLNAAYSYSGGLSASDNVLHDVTTPTFHPTYPQYNCSTEQASIQYPPQSVMNILPAVNSPPMQTNDSKIFRFDIPGFHIVILPTTSPLVNLNDPDLQYQLQQIQLNQEQSHVSNVSDGSSINTQSTLFAQQHQHDQQLNYLESFNNFNFCRPSLA